jgi:DNA-binding MarR family transcriptional regulator
LTIDPSDQRGRRASLTRKGTVLLAKAVPVWERTSMEVEALLEEGDSERLRTSLRVLSSMPAPQ